MQAPAPKEQNSEKIPVPCERCRGTGIVDGIECRECLGRGHRVVVAGRLVPPASGSDPPAADGEHPYR
jgi:RecJ-like exonuclease